MRLETLLAGHALRRPNHLALVFGDQRITYRDLFARVDRCAAGFRRLGVQPGDRVLMVLPNCVEFVVAEYAAFRLGAVVVTVNPRLADREIAHMLLDSQPVVAVYRASERARLLSGVHRLPGLKRVVVDGAQTDEIAFEDLAATAPVALPHVPANQDDALIMYTSGTTGQPKGAVVTHANMIVQNLFLQAQAWRLTEDDRFLAINPLAHRAGCARLYDALGLGGTLVLVDKFDPNQVLQLIEDERITMCGLAPTVIRMLLPRLSERPRCCVSLRCIVVSTEAFPVPLMQELIALIPNAEIHSVFGSTEVLATNLHHVEQLTHPGSVGRPYPGVEVRLVDDAGAPVGAGEVGELLVRSGEPGRWATMRGYFNLPAETAATIRDGWVHTGDLARADADGYLYIVDRKKDMVISGGYNIYSKEVEQVLVSHPLIEDAAIIGVPDPVFGEAVAAFVQLRSGASLSAEEVVEHCRASLASYKKPKHVAFTSALPRNATGKILKNELRAEFDRARNNLKESTST